MEDIGRKHPAKGVQVSLSEPTIVFLTVCTEKRHPWVASAAAHALLLDAWKAADRWLVGRYVLMPDHVHLFCAPGDIETKLDQWVRFWKSHVSRHSSDPAWRWQTDFWDTRLRRGENYSEKWEYVRENPVRAGLATTQDARRMAVSGRHPRAEMVTRREGEAPSEPIIVGSHGGSPSRHGAAPSRACAAPQIG